MNSKPATQGRIALRSRRKHWLVSLVLVVPFWTTPAQGQSCQQIQEFYFQKLQNLSNIGGQTADVMTSLGNDRGHVDAHCASLRKLDADFREEASLVGDLIGTLQSMCGVAGADLALLRKDESGIKETQETTAGILDFCPPATPIWKAIVQNEIWIDDSTIQKRGPSGGVRMVWAKSIGDPSEHNGLTEAWTRFAIDCGRQQYTLTGSRTFIGDKQVNWSWIVESNWKWESVVSGSIMAETLKYACSR